MGPILVHGRNLEPELRELELRPGHGGYAMLANGSRAIFKVQWLFSSIIFLEMCVGIHDHLAYSRYRLWIGFKVEEAIPYDRLGGLDIPHDIAGPSASHVILKLNSFAFLKSTGLIPIKSGEREWKWFAGEREGGGNVSAEGSPFGVWFSGSVIIHFHIVFCAEDKVILWLLKGYRCHGGHIR